MATHFISKPCIFVASAPRQYYIVEFKDNKYLSVLVAIGTYEIRTRSSVEHSSITDELAYILQLTDEATEEYNTDEYMSLYSSVPRNIKVYSSVRGIYCPPPWPCIHIGSYVHRLTEEDIGFLYNPYFGYLSGWGASKTSYTTDLYSNRYSLQTTRHKSTIIHIVFTQQYIVIVLRHKYITYNSIMVLRHCMCHCPRRILPCLEPHR
jgi:hypothetical protein